MSDRGRSSSPPSRDVDVDMDNATPDKADARVVVVTNLSRNVVEAHLQTVFSFYGEIVKIDLPVYAKSGQNRGKAALEYVEPAAAQKAASHMNGGQLDGAVVKVELSDLPVRTRSRSPAARGPRRALRGLLAEAATTDTMTPTAASRRLAGFLPSETHTVHARVLARGRPSEGQEVWVWALGGGLLAMSPLSHEVAVPLALTYALPFSFLFFLFAVQQEPQSVEVA
ncbi:hypothetical protein FA95DRAFT_1601387 [Auriscalpium vulgare]|uniref:Uncharacterized protein n=1 Tax=Auriscalpium vulgare TaxID=40419 RepID=A0ACB8S8V0_9AGAM|nr:hypothetical protein FA95DRAFT_1601387 [Auriscalpium vulgare]